MDLSLSDVGWQAHPEVWLLVGGVLAIGWYVSRVLEPKATAAGYEPIRRSQKFWFLLAVGGMWGASDWPVHDVAERYLYAVHMFQHLFLSMLIPAMFLLSMPRWLFDLVLTEGGRARRWLATGSKPLVAGLTFNAITTFLHWSKIVQWSFESGPLHFALHLVVFASGLLMWMPVIGPVESWRLTPIAQCIYLFMMSILPTVPGGWLVFAEEVVYRHYDTVDRLWGVGVLTDQQAAGAVMKLVGGFFLWAVIVTIFARWATAEAAQDEAARRARHRVAAVDLTGDQSGDLTHDQTGNLSDDLTFEQVSEEFSRTAAPAETPPRS